MTPLGSSFQSLSRCRGLCPRKQREVCVWRGRDGWRLSKGGNRVLIVVSEPPERCYHPGGRRKGLDEVSSENQTGKMDIK